MASRLKAFGVFLQETLPTEFREVFSGYLRTSQHGATYLLSEEIDHGIHFVGLTAMRKGQTDTWKIQIPNSYVLAIVEVSDPSQPIGFL